MLAFDPAHGVIRLVDVVRELRVSTVVQQPLVRSSGKLNAWEGRVRYPSETDLCGISLAETVGDFPPETTAKSKQELVHQRWSENVVVADAGVSSALRGDAAEDGPQV